ncbi:MAG: hypothetical protein V2I43_21975, partial [Parvularcula sp.]|nr:hypothetical protein [Parvularcula sp.]
MTPTMLQPRRAATALLLALSLSVATAPVVSAFAQNQNQEEEDRRRSRQTLSARTGQALNEALNFANEEPPRTQDALRVVD